MEIAPCYFVSGNHEARIDEYERFISGLTELGVNVLNDSKAEITLAGESIELLGVSDPSFRVPYLSDYSAGVIRNGLEQLMTDGDGFYVLLSHRPELFEVYAEYGLDLVLSGHAHGGQFRLPILGGVWSPNQGFFPEYDSGLYKKSNTNMVVSRGIGNSKFPFRFNNRPEVIVVELKTEQ